MNAKSPETLTCSWTIACASLDSLLKILTSLESSETKISPLLEVAISSVRLKSRLRLRDRNSSPSTLGGLNVSLRLTNWDITLSCSFDRTLLEEVAKIGELLLSSTLLYPGVTLSCVAGNSRMTISNDGSVPGPLSTCAASTACKPDPLSS